LSKKLSFKELKSFKILIFQIISLVLIDCNVSNGQTIFQKSFNNDAESLRDFVYLDDSTIYFTGSWRNCSSCNYYPILGKANANFEIEWSYKFADSAIASKLLILDDGLIVFGNKTNLSDYQYFLMKVDFSGNIVWSFSYGTNFIDLGNVCKTTSGFLITGRSNVIDSIGNDSTLFNVLSIDSVGTLNWYRSYFIGDGFNVAGSDLMPDTSYLISGTLYNIDSSQFVGVLIKLSSSGDIVWARNYSIPNVNLFFTTAPIFINNKIYTGGGVSYPLVNFPFLISTNDSGSVEFSNSFTRPLGGLSPYSISHSFDSTKIILLFGNGIILTDSTGSFEGSFSYNPNFPANSNYYKAVPTSDNGLLLAGYNTGGNGDIFVVKTDSLYDGGCGVNVNSFTISNENATSSVINSQEFVIPMITTAIVFSSDSLILTQQIYCQTATSILEPYDLDILRVYPNPASNFITIECENIEGFEPAVIKVYRSDGSLILLDLLNNASNQINIEHLSSGFYVLKIEVNKQILHKKFIKL